MDIFGAIVASLLGFITGWNFMKGLTTSRRTKVNVDHLKYAKFFDYPGKDRR